MNLSKLQANIDALREFVQSNGWTIIDEKIFNPAINSLLPME